MFLYQTVILIFVGKLIDCFFLPPCWLKVYTCASESVLAQFIPFSTPKFKFYRDWKVQSTLYARLGDKLQVLKEKVSIFYVKLQF